MNSYPTDPYSSLDYWPEGFEQLTLVSINAKLKLKLEKIYEISN